MRPGDTASRIAAAHASANISLEQMLVAMLRANPTAFANGNINLIKSGAVLDLPDPAQAAALTPAQARQTLIAQSRDFNTVRRKLAAGAPSVPVAAAERSSSGKLEAQVQDAKPATTAPDKLTLSRGTIDSTAAGTDKQPSPQAGAPTLTAESAAAKAQEPQGNSSEPNRLQSISQATVPAPDTAATATEPTAHAPAAPVPAQTTQTASASAATPAASAPGSSIAAPAAVTAKPTSAAQEAAEPGWVDQIIDEPLVPALGLGLIALLGGFGIHRSRQRKKAQEEEKAFFAEAGAQPNSFFSVMGGHEIDTQSGRSHGSPVTYSPSQLDTGGTVDPIAEADLYLAYGRDQQAVDILVDALRAEPGRLAARMRLLEIHARRKAVRAFESLAAESRSAVAADSIEWQRISEMGRQLDPSNPLYRPVERNVASAALGAASAAAFATRPTPLPGADSLPDLNLTTDPAPAPSCSARRAAAAPLDVNATHDSTQRATLELDLDLSDFGSLQPLSTDSKAVSSGLTNSARHERGDAEQKPAPWLAAARPEPAEPKQSTPAAAPTSAATAGMIDFDFGSLRLDLVDEPVAAPSNAKPVESVRAASQDAHEQETVTSDAAGDGDALSMKLALAEAFNAIGDGDGARSLLQEVISEGAGTVKAKAQRLLMAIQ